MTALLILIPVALFLGMLGLFAFLWSLRSGQFDDLDGAAVRILDEAHGDRPRPFEAQVTTSIAVRPRGSVIR
jgi:cbb3-type cytochrome oxidase maturation protein